ncbi:multidrug effflux MFS transporter [Limnobacter sp.]|uniref:multidrug effflux MFS transporter n=1 Tax=Limnobacter sp. TaxID=2003368 RepID=UPI002582F02A|nr:multidrug effflux MFS transporter [Limnobacter sp.]
MIQRRTFFLLASLTAVAPLAIDLYLPSFGDIAKSLHRPFADIQLTVTVFLLGFAIGMLFYGPLSDRFGRRRVIFAGLATFVFASAACTVSQTLDQLLVFRVIQAFGGGATAVISRAVVRDLMGETEAARVIALLAITTALVPLCAPLAGAFVLELGSWRFEFVVLTAFGLTALVAAYNMLPETHRGHSHQHSLKTAFQGYRIVLCKPQSWPLIASGGLLYAAMFAYITGTPFVYMSLYGLSQKAYGLLFGLNILSLSTLGFATSRLVTRTGTRFLIQRGGQLAMLGACLVLLAGWLGVPQALSLPILVIGLMCCVGSVGLIGPNCAARLMESFPANAGAASALLGFSQFGLGALSSASVSWLADGSAHPMTGIVAACAACAFVATRLIQTPK